MPCLTHGGVMQCQIARERVDRWGRAPPDPGARLLHVVDHGLHLTRLTRMAHRPGQGTDEARRRLGDHPGLAAELGGALAGARAHGRNGGIVGLDDRAGGPGLAWREAMNIEAFRRGLHALGYVEGQNIMLEYRYADGNLEQLPPLAAELVRLNVAVIVTTGTTPTRAAQQATKTIPLS
jgi:hypothetical protein